MDTNSISSTFLSFLMMAVLLLSYSADGVSLSSSTSISQQSSFCKNTQQTSIVKDQPSEVTQEGSEATSTQGATISSSCSISLQVIPVEKRYVLSPSESSLVFTPYNSVISSQAFATQEPDPPQTV